MLIKFDYFKFDSKLKLKVLVKMIKLCQMLELCFSFCCPSQFLGRKLTKSSKSVVARCGTAEKANVLNLEEIFKKF